MDEGPPLEPEHRSQTFWSELRHVMRGGQRDYTSGSLVRAIVLLSVPMVLEMFMQAVFEVADVFFVGKLGADAVAAVGIAATVLILVFAVGIGLSMAATAMVARRIGEGDTDAAARAAFQSLVIAVIVSVPVVIVGLTMASPIIRLMGGTETVAQIGSGYFKIMFGSNLVILLLFLINAIFRGTGDAIIAMRVLWLANLLNIVLDPILIFGLGPIPAMGVTGAAVATVIGRSVGVLYQIRMLVSGRGRITIRRRNAVLHLPTMRRLLEISGPGVLQYLVGTASWLGIMRLLGEFGSAVQAGYTISVRVIVFAILPSWGMGNAAATLVGQNLGARSPERAARSVWMTGAANTVFLTLFGLYLLIDADSIMRLFSTDPDVLGAGALCLRIVAFSYPFFGYGMVIVQAFNGAGDTRTPTWINLISYWILQLPMAYVLGFTLGYGPSGIFAGIAAAQAALAIISVMWFRTGKWKRVEV